MFITSRSADVLRSLDAPMEEEPERENLMSVYSLDRYDRDEIRVWRHDRGSPHHALDYEIFLFPNDEDSGCFEHLLGPV